MKKSDNLNDERKLYDPEKSHRVTIDKMKTNIVEYKDQIRDTRGEIIKTMNTNINVFNHIGQELNEQTDSMNRTIQQLDILEEKLDFSKKLVKNLSSWFSFFKKIPTEPSIHINSESKIKTRFEKTDIETLDDIYENKNTVKKYESEEEQLIMEAKRAKKEERDFYDQLLKGIDVLDRNSKTINKILTEHNDQTATIEDKVEKSDEIIRKNTQKLKKC